MFVQMVYQIIHADVYDVDFFIIYDDMNYN